MKNFDMNSTCHLFSIAHSNESLVFNDVSQITQVVDLDYIPDLILVDAYDARNYRLFVISSISRTDSNTFGIFYFYS